MREMKVSILAAAAAFAAAAATAQTAAQTAPAPAPAPAAKAAPAAKPESVASIVERSTGGRLIALYKTTRKVFFVNAQGRVGKEVVEAARRKMQEVLRTPVDFAEGTFDFAAPKVMGELSLYVIDDEKMPMSLVAPEGRWAFVNVAPLAKGRGEKPQFLEARVRKECARVGCMLFGGISSTYKQNLLSFAGSPEDLDKFETDNLPVDGPMRCQRYLLSLGVKPYRHVTYRKACEEGWAPAPTNDVQKAIWEQVHQIPATPMKIEFDPKKGR